MPGLLDPENWEILLRKDLPGPGAQLEMAPEGRQDPTWGTGAIEAAVMALIYPLDGQTGLVFMKRNAYDGPHSAQVSFPGGAREIQDRSLEDTALRETREELGINEDITVAGCFSSLHIPVSNFQVTPFIGITTGRPAFHPDPTEVQYIIETTVEALLDPRIRKREAWQLHGETREVPYFLVNGEKIWGATAMMLAEFLQLASRLPSHRC